jgi:hypothetical protein
VGFVITPTRDCGGIIRKKLQQSFQPLFQERKIMTIKNTLTKNLPHENTEPLLDRKAAAKYLNVSPGTLAV